MKRFLLSEVKAIVWALAAMRSAVALQPPPIGLVWLGTNAVVSAVKRGDR